MTEFDATEVDGITHELWSCHQLHLTVQLSFYLCTLHLCGRLELFGSGLSRETFLIGTVDGVAHIEEVFRHQQHILRHEREEGDLLPCPCRQLWYDLHLFPLFPRELVLHLKGTDGVDIIAKEVDTVGIFATEGIDVEDGTTLSKLSGFVDVVHLTKTKGPQRLPDFSH